MDKQTQRDFVELVRGWFNTTGPIPLHAPVLGETEKEFVVQSIESTFVSSVGKYVSEFEDRIAAFTGANAAVATVTGTAALHVALHLLGVKRDDLVVTQSLTFAATCAAIRYCDAYPAFVDIDSDTLGMSPTSLSVFFEQQCVIREHNCIHLNSGRTVRACLPMHTFGHPARIDEIASICAQYNVAVVEDAAEGIGSFRAGNHVGTRGDVGTLSFNGNKTITTGGGGMLLFQSQELATKAKHLTTTAKVPHPWHYEHDMVGFNYRLPNINAALGCAQMESLKQFLDSKRALAGVYKRWCIANNLEWVSEPEECRSNYWLMAIKLGSLEERDSFLRFTNASDITTRPAWTPMHHLKMYRDAPCAPLTETEKIFDLVVNIPSSALPGE